MHVHVGVDDPDKAIHVANGMRVHLAVLLALSANSPFWRADATGLLSARTPIFRTFPRVGIPPHYRDWARLRARDRLHGRVRGHGGLHLALVRRAPAPEVRHGRGAGVRLADARRAHARARRARPGDGQGALRALRRRRHARRLPVADARREQVAGGPPRARGRARRPALQRARGHQGAGAPPAATACASTPRTSARPPSSRRSTTCWRAATAPSASWSSTRPTTTCARSWPRSSRRRRPDEAGLGLAKRCASWWRTPSTKPSSVCWVSASMASKLTPLPSADVAHDAPARGHACRGRRAGRARRARRPTGPCGPAGRRRR